ncbi:hypothetical protein V8B97DRAFT_1919142 [Scleroderma yunnanense]
MPHPHHSSTTDLCEEILPQFQDIFIPTVLAYCSIALNPWDLQQPLHVIIANLWPVVFPQIPYEEQLYGVGTPTHNIACQCVYDWHRGFATTADKTGIDHFWRSLILQALGYHYGRTVNAVSCSQMDVYYPCGALSLATVAVEQAISMWVEFGQCIKDSEGDAGQFSRSSDIKWDVSSAAFTHSIAMLRQTAWEKIEAGTLHLMGNDPQEQAMGVTEQNMKHAYDKTIFAHPPPCDVSETPEEDPHTMNPQHVPLQPLVTGPDVAGYSDSQPSSVVTADCHLLPLMSPFILKTSATFLPAPVILASQISIWLLILCWKLVVFLLKTTNNLVIIPPILLFLSLD